MIIIIIIIIITFTVQAILAIHGLYSESKLLLLLPFLPGDHYDDGGEKEDDVDEEDYTDKDDDDDDVTIRSVFWSTIIFGSMKLIKMLRVSTEVRSFVIEIFRKFKRT